MSNLLKNVKDWDDKTYHSTGIHYSTLQNIHNEELYRLDPETRDAAREELSGKQVVNNGQAFEDYIEDPIAYESKYYTLTATRSSNAMEHTLCTELINRKIDPNDIEKVAEVIIELGLWKSDTKAKRGERAALDMGVKQYVIEQQYLLNHGENLITIPGSTHNAIVESSITLEKEYNELFNPADAESILMDEMQVMLEFDQFAVKLDRIIIYKDKSGDMYARVLDYKFKDSDPSTWHSKFYWKYGYWIQGVLYSYVVQNCLSDDVTFEGFWFVIGSNSHPQRSCVVEHPEEVNKMLTKDVKFESGYVRPSVGRLVADYQWHMKNNKFKWPVAVYENNGYLKPNVPVTIQDDF